MAWHAFCLSGMNARMCELKSLHLLLCVHAGAYLYVRRPAQLVCVPRTILMHWSDGCQILFPCHASWKRWASAVKWRTAEAWALESMRVSLDGFVTAGSCSRGTSIDKCNENSACRYHTIPYRRIRGTCQVSCLASNARTTTVTCKDSRPARSTSCIPLKA